MNRKASIQVSVNFLVVIIISIIIMGFGFVLIKQMLGNDIPDQMDERLRGQIEDSLMESNARVSIPVIQREIERGEFDYFGVGVLNLDGTQTFTVDVTYAKLATDLSSNTNVDTFPTYGPGLDPSLWIIPFTRSEEIDNNNHYVFGVPIRVPDDARSNTEYVYTLNVMDQLGNVYDGPFKLYVKVP